MSFVYCAVGIFGLLVHVCTCASGSMSGANESHHVHLAVVDFKRVESHISLCLWLLFSIFAKIVFHWFKKVSDIIPESCLLILLGVLVGCILKSGNLTDLPFFTADLFFLILLPPIVLDAGYFINTSAFFENFWTINLFAVVGTLFNAIIVGVLMVVCSPAYTVRISWIEGLIFGSLIAAVDPVAVLAVFDELHVNETLYIIVFGESLLNDAVTVVLYHLFEQLNEFPYVSASDIGMGVALFFVVSLGGISIGLAYGLIGSFTTRFTKHVSVMEPLLVLLLSYLSYLTAEVFHFSGILSIFFCGIVLKYYVEINVSNQSRTAIKYLIKTLSSSSETYIFMQLGVSLFMFKMEWDTGFIFLALLFTFVVRCIGVLILTFFINLVSSSRRIGLVEQSIMSYGGLRGAVAFSLALVLPDIRPKDVFVAATVFIVLFTVFIQGISIKPIVKILKVKLTNDSKKSIFTEIIDIACQKAVRCGEAILGVQHYDVIRAFLYMVDKKVLRKAILRREYLNQCDDLILKNRNILYREAEGLVETNPYALFYRDKSRMDIAANLTYSTLLSFKKEPFLRNEPILDYNIIDQLRKNDWANERPVLSSIVGMKDTSQPRNKYTLSGIGEREVNKPKKKNRDVQVRVAGEVAREDGNKQVPDELMISVVMEPLSLEKTSSVDVRQTPYAATSEPESLKRVGSRFKVHEEPKSLLNIPTIKELSQSTGDMPVPDPGGQRQPASRETPQ